MERYEIVKDIGSGNFGVAKMVRDKRTRELFAVKFIERGQKVCFIYSIFLLVEFELQILFFPSWGHRFIWLVNLRVFLFWFFYRLMST